MQTVTLHILITVPYFDSW